MAIFAIGDLHLSFGQNKPMDIFGENWKDHYKKIKKSWEETVNCNDTVLIPGDFSWAMHLKDTIDDFTYLNTMPGKKLLLKGNHDYWWTTLKSMRQFLKDNNFENIDFVYNNSYLVENKIIAGTRGWVLADTAEDSKMIKREKTRLELSIKDGIDKYGKDKEILILMHYPPLNKQTIENSPFIDIMKKYNVKKCIYGHLHGDSHKDAIEGDVNNIQFELVSADYLNFNIKKI